MFACAIKVSHDKKFKFFFSRMKKFFKILSHIKSSKCFSTIVQNEIKKKCPKPSIFIRTFKFCNKVLIVGSLFYYTASKGVWGTPEQTQHFFCNLNNNLKNLLPLHIRTLLWPEDDEK